MQLERDFEILIESPGKIWLEENNIADKWDIWTSPVDNFDWKYSQEEWAYIIEGEVIVTTDSGNTYDLKSGNLVKFAKDLKCNWNVIKPIKKYYTFK